MTARPRRLLDDMRNLLRTPAAGVLTALYASYVVYIMNRKSVSLCLPTLMSSGISTSTAGLIVSSQNAAYTVSKVAGGIASDYFNPRRLLGLGLVCCGITTLLFSYADDERGFVIAWLLNGISHGAGWPACAKILQTAAPAHFGTMWSILSTSVNLSGVLSPLLAAFLIPALGWQWNLRLISGISVLTGLVCLVAIAEPAPDTTTAATSPSKNKKKPPLASNVAGEPATLGQLLRSPLLWLVSFCYLVVFCTKTALTDWCQVFLIGEYGMTPDIGSKFSSSIEFGGFVGTLVVGYLTDKCIQTKTKKDGANTIHVRMLCALTCAIGVCALMHFLCFNIDAKSSQVILLLIGSLLGAFTYGQIVMYGIVASVMVPPHLSGTSHSIVSLAANVGAVMSGYPLANIAGRYDWRTAFALLEVASGIAVVVLFACRGMTRTKVKIA